MYGFFATSSFFGGYCLLVGDWDGDKFSISYFLFGVDFGFGFGAGLGAGVVGILLPRGSINPIALSFSLLKSLLSLSLGSINILT